jgi:hypothetical protein
MDTLATRYCRIAWLPSNHGRVFSIGTAWCCKGKAIHNSELVSLRQLVSRWKQKKSVSLRNQKSQCSKWDISAVQFCQWDPRSYQYEC